MSNRDPKLEPLRVERIDEFGRETTLNFLGGKFVFPCDANGPCTKDDIFFVVNEAKQIEGKAACDPLTEVARVPVPITKTMEPGPRFCMVGNRTSANSFDYAYRVATHADRGFKDTKCKPGELPVVLEDRKSVCKNLGEKQWCPSASALNYCPSTSNSRTFCHSVSVKESPDFASNTECPKDIRDYVLLRSGNDNFPMHHSIPFDMAKNDPMTIRVTAPPKFDGSILNCTVSSKKGVVEKLFEDNFRNGKDFTLDRTNYEGKTQSYGLDCELLKDKERIVLQNKLVVFAKGKAKVETVNATTVRCFNDPTPDPEDFFTENRWNFTKATLENDADLKWKKHHRNVAGSKEVAIRYVRGVHDQEGAHLEKPSDEERSQNDMHRPESTQSTSGPEEPSDNQRFQDDSNRADSIRQQVEDFLHHKQNQQRAGNDRTEHLSSKVAGNVECHNQLCSEDVIGNRTYCQNESTASGRIEGIKDDISSWLKSTIKGLTGTDDNTERPKEEWNWTLIILGGVGVALVVGGAVGLFIWWYKKPKTKPKPKPKPNAGTLCFHDSYGEYKRPSMSNIKNAYESRIRNLSGGLVGGDPKETTNDDWREEFRGLKLAIDNCTSMATSDTIPAPWGRNTFKKSVMYAEIRKYEKNGKWIDDPIMVDISGMSDLNGDPLMVGAMWTGHSTAFDYLHFFVGHNIALVVITRSMDEQFFELFPMKKLGRSGPYDNSDNKYNTGKFYATTTEMITKEWGTRYKVKVDYEFSGKAKRKIDQDQWSNAFNGSCKANHEMYFFHITQWDKDCGKMPSPKALAEAFDEIDKMHLELEAKDKPATVYLCSDGQVRSFIAASLHLAQQQWRCKKWVKMLEVVKYICHYRPGCLASQGYLPDEKDAHLNLVIDVLKAICTPETGGIRQLRTPVADHNSAEEGWSLLGGFETMLRGIIGKKGIQSLAKSESKTKSVIETEAVKQPKTESKITQESKSQTQESHSLKKTETKSKGPTSTAIDKPKSIKPPESGSKVAKETKSPKKGSQSQSKSGQSGKSLVPEVHTSKKNRELKSLTKSVSVQQGASTKQRSPAPSPSPSPKSKSVVPSPTPGKSPKSGTSTAVKPSKKK